MSFTLNSGNQHFYCILGCWKPVHDLFTYNNYEDHLTASIFGFGTRILKDSFNFDFEGWISSVYHTVDEDKDDDDHHCDTILSYRFVFGHQPVKHFRVFAAASAMCDFYNAGDTFRRMFTLVDINCGDKVHIYPQIEVGVKYSLND